MKINDIIHHWTRKYDLIGRVESVMKDRVICGVIKDNNNNWTMKNFRFNPKEDNHKGHPPEEYPEYYL